MKKTMEIEMRLRSLRKDGEAAGNEAKKVQGKYNYTLIIF